MCIRDRAHVLEPLVVVVDRNRERAEGDLLSDLSLIHISEPTRLLSISYAVFCLQRPGARQRASHLVGQRRHAAAERAGVTVRWADFDPTTGELAPEAVGDLLSD